MKQSSESSTPAVNAIKGNKWRQQAGAAKLAWHALSEDLAGVNVDEPPKLDEPQLQPAGPIQER
jgi:hypothetical protein